MSRRDPDFTWWDDVVGVRVLGKPLSQKEGRVGNFHPVDRNHNGAGRRFG